MEVLLGVADVLDGDAELARDSRRAEVLNVEELPGGGQVDVVGFAAGQDEAGDAVAGRTPGEGFVDASCVQQAGAVAVQSLAQWAVQVAVELLVFVLG